ncbi:Patatin-like protein 2 [Zea mays]|uniref:Patatin-like protein 2 n=1 Tax=Zea mays TaxID=4577 RepID=A0A1D6F7H7_MAIZE|nr:Patatin-like protein 2 [Zea mays]
MVAMSMLTKEVLRRNPDFNASFSGYTTAASPRSSTSSPTPAPTWSTSMLPFSSRPSTVRRTTFAFRMIL